MRALLDDHAHWQLFERSRQGDREAARRFERYWSDAARRFAGRGLTPEQIDEFTSAFFERVYSRLTSFRWERPFAAYLRVVLINLSRDALRRVRRSLLTEIGIGDLEGTERELAAADRSAEQALIDREQEARVQAALRRLAPIDRHVLIELLVEERPGTELARLLGIRPAALYQRLKRAKDRLRRELKRPLSGS